jgi:predicted amidohydrolase YtcJ
MTSPIRIATLPLVRSWCLSLPVLAAAAIVLQAGAASAQEVADRIWSGGPILTMSDAAMRAEAVAEKGGRIIAVGPLATIMAHKGAGTRMIDLGGRAMLPGFFDAHGHVFIGGLQALSANLLAPPDGPVTDIATLLKTVKDWVAANESTVQAAKLIIGFGYDNASLAEQRHPTRDDLDKISTELPVYLVHQSGHFGAANSKALEVAGITRDTPQPSGGMIRHRADGEPDGVLEELAHAPVMVKLLSRTGLAGAKAMAKAGAELWARFGYTTAEEGGAIPAVSEVLRQVAAEGGFRIDVLSYANVLVDRDYVRANASSNYVNRYRVAGGKLVIDGSPQGFTAWRDRPYYNPVGSYPPGYVGYGSATQEMVTDAIDWGYANGVQVITHANGEHASDMLIAAQAAAQAKHGRPNLRPVLIHGQLLREDQVDAYNRLGVTPSLFPMHTFYWGDWHRDHTVGPALADNISPTGWVLARGMKLSSHHDAPVAFPDSMRVLDATVTRRSRTGDILGPSQRVDVITALKAMTIWPAWHHFEDKTKGSIEVGKLADLVILSKDPTAVDPETLDQLKVTETIKEGVTVFAADADQKRGDLMIQPNAAGADAFSRFLRRAAIEREIAALPASRRNDPRARAAIEAAPHDAFCLSPVLIDMAAAIVGGDSPIGR